MKSYIVALFVVVCLALVGFAEQPCADPGTTIFHETEERDWGTEHIGIHYKVKGQAGPATAPAENAGEYCVKAEIAGGSHKKYSLACTLLYSLFGLQVDWANEMTNYSAFECSACCNGPACQTGSIYLMELWNYRQKPVRKYARTKNLNPLSDWSDWEPCTPCETRYCLLETFSHYVCVGQNAEWDPPRKTGNPPCELPPG